VLFEASPDRSTALFRIHVDHTDVAEHCATLTLTRRLSAQIVEMCVVRLERVEERIARGHGREGERRWDQGLRGHGSVAVWQRDQAWSREETREDGQFTRDVGAVEVVCWVWLLKKASGPKIERGDVRGAEGKERAIVDRDDVKRHTVYPLSRAVRTTVEKASPSVDPAENSLKM
jgi:hypothetical protein